MAGDPAWLTLILVGGPTTLFSATSLALAVLNKTKKQGERDGAGAADLEDLADQIKVIKDDVKAQGAAATAFREEFVAFKAANQTAHEFGKETLTEIKRGLANLHAQMSHVGSGAAGTVMELGARRDGG
jgi:hypothetical protein